MDPLEADNKAKLLHRAENDFTFHAASDEQRVTYGEIRAQLLCSAEYLIGRCPTGRELSVALTKLEEAMFWANAAIARNT